MDLHLGATPTYGHHISTRTSHGVQTGRHSCMQPQWVVLTALSMVKRAKVCYLTRPRLCLHAYLLANNDKQTPE